MRMVPYSYKTISCPSCDKVAKLELISVALVPVTTGLGPPVFRCTRCDEIYQSGLQEWTEMSAKRRVRYTLVSLANSLGLGALLALALGPVFGLVAVTGGAVAIDASLLAPMAVITLSIIGIQALRVILSIRRADDDAEPFRASFLSWQTNLQFWGMSFVLTALLIGGIFVALAD